MDCEYYDGSSAVPIIGKLFIKPNEFEFITEDEFENKKQIIGFREIRSIESTGNSYKIDLKASQSAGISPLYVVKDLSSYQEVSEIWKSSKNEFPFRALNAFSRLSTPVKIASSLLLVLIFVTLFVVSLDKIHIFIPKYVDKKIGSFVSSKILESKEVCQDKRLNMFLKKSVSILSQQNTDWDFKVKILREDEVNAISLPDGSVYIFSALIEESDSPEEVVGVLAHEMSHVENRHGVRQLIRVIGITFLVTSFIGLGGDTFETMETFNELVNTFILLKYSRGFEQEADRGAVQKLNDAKISTDGFIYFFEKFGELNKYLSWMSSHPADSERIAFIKQNTSKEKKSKSLFKTERKNWNEIKMGCSL